jgi:hypothetical protein
MCRIFHIFPTCGHTYYRYKCCLSGELVWFGRFPPIKGLFGCDDTDLSVRHLVTTPTRCLHCINGFFFPTSLIFVPLETQRAALYSVLPLTQLPSFHSGALLNALYGKRLPNDKDFQSLITYTKRVDLVMQMQQYVYSRLSFEEFKIALRYRGRLRDFLLNLVSKVEVNIADRVLTSYLNKQPSDLISTPVSLLPVEHQTCPICIMGLEEWDAAVGMETAVKTSCNHVFGARCLESWFLTSGKRSCPLCRHAFASPPTYERRFRTFRNFRVLDLALSSKRPEWDYLLEGPIDEKWVKLFERN